VDTNDLLPCHSLDFPLPPVCSAPGPVMVHEIHGPSIYFTPLLECAFLLAVSQEPFRFSSPFQLDLACPAAFLFEYGKDLVA